MVKGEITLVLENDERHLCRPGDLVVQRGTIHAWYNEGTEWARMYAFMLGECLSAFRLSGKRC